MSAHAPLVKARSRRFSRAMNPDDRARRRAQALRENLKKRKAQAREAPPGNGAAPSSDPPAPPDNSDE